VGEEDIIVER
jgi:hypothetical protein